MSRMFLYSVSNKLNMNESITHFRIHLLALDKVPRNDGL